MVTGPPRPADSWRSLRDAASPVGSGPHGRGPASALNRLFSTATETGPTRADPPQGEATPEIESVDLEEILI